MRLMFDLPEKEKAVLDGAMQQNEKLMYCVPFNIYEDRFVSGYIAVTNRHIYKLLDDKLLGSWAIAGATGFKTEVMYGSCGFYANFGEGMLSGTAIIKKSSAKRGVTGRSAPRI